MSLSYPGGYISKTPPTPTSTSAPGIWTLDQAMQYTKSGNWPVPVPPPDPYFEYTTLLLPGNGTNGAQNNTFLDSSGSSVSITRNGGSTQGTFSPFSQTGWGNYFLASNSDVISLGTLFLNSISSSTATFTMEAWVYLNSFGTNATSFYNRTILAKGQIYLNFGIDQNGKLMLYHYDGTTRTNASTNAISLNTWTHVAAVVNGSGTITFYINGVANGTATWYGHIGTNQTARLGGTQDPNGGVNNYWNGYISNVRTTSTQVYTSAFTPSTTPLTAIPGTTFLSCQSNRFVDNSSNGYTLTIAAGTPSVQAFSPFNPTAVYSAATNGGSGYFAGYGNYLTFSNSIWTALAGVNTTFTVEAWVYRTAADSQSSDICGTNVSGYTQSVTFNISTSGALQFSDWGNGSSYTATATASGSVPLNAWTHVAASKSGSTMRLFVNGVLLATNTIVNASISTLDGSPANVAGRPAGATMFIGYMSSLRIVPGTAVYTADFTPPTGPLTAISGTSLLLNFTNAGIIDNTAKNDLQTVGSAQISTSVSKFGGGSVSFNGSSGTYLASAAGNTYISGTEDFTIEGWLNLNSISSTQTIVSGNTNNSLFLRYGQGYTVTQGLNIGRQSVADAEYCAFTFATGTWYHIAVCRSNGVIYFFVNGTQQTTQGSGVASYSFPVTATYNVGYFGVEPLNGYLDDLRITKGVARYTSNFTPPTAAFPLY